MVNPVLENYSILHDHPGQGSPLHGWIGVDGILLFRLQGHRQATPPWLTLFPPLPSLRRVGSLLPVIVAPPRLLRAGVGVDGMVQVKARRSRRVRLHGALRVHLGRLSALAAAGDTVATAVLNARTERVTWSA